MLVTLSKLLGCMFLSVRGVLLMQIFLLVLVSYSVLLSELTGFAILKSSTAALLHLQIIKVRKL